VRGGSPVSSGAAADVHQDTAAQQQGDPEHGPDGCPSDQAQLASRVGEIRRLHLGLDEHLPAARRNQECVRRSGRGRSEPGAERDRYERRRHDERIVALGRGTPLTQRLLDDDGGQAHRSGSIAVGHRFNPDQSSPRSHEERGRPLDTLLGQVGDPARPGDGNRGGMGVDRHTRAADRLVGQRGGQRVEEPAEGRVVSRGGLDETL
jgi:hypothetical protein